jgi:hypothetical protein
MHPAWPALLAVLLLTSQPLQAGWAEGMAAYERKDGRAARAEFMPIARRGDPEAQYYLGRLYYYPEYGKQRYPAAFRWFQRAARQGHAEAQYKLGGMYFAGRGVKADDRQAVHWWRQAAARGHGESLNNLGALYANGRGVPRDPPAAYALQSLALAAGNELAAENLRNKEAEFTAGELAAARALAAAMAVPGKMLAELDRHAGRPAGRAGH